jgi:hypothetical protein
MKNSFLLLLLCIMTHMTAAQRTIDKHLNFSPGAKIDLNIQIADSIRIITWNKNEVYIKASININDNKDNDDYEWTFDEQQGVRINAKLKERKNWSNNWKDNYHYRSTIYCDIYVPQAAAFSVETINGNITITGKTAAIKAYSISGFIDLSFSPDRKADIKLNTVSGTVYTDLVLSARSQSSVPTYISEKYNGGGENIDLKTVSGDIYLRKF